MSEHADVIRTSLNAMQSFVQCQENFTETVAATWCEGVEAVAALEAELAEAQRERDALIQEMEHPFDKPEFDRMFARAEAAEAALRQIAAGAWNNNVNEFARAALASGSEGDGR